MESRIGYPVGLARYVVSEDFSPNGRLDSTFHPPPKKADVAADVSHPVRGELLPLAGPGRGAGTASKAAAMKRCCDVGEEEMKITSYFWLGGWIRCATDVRRLTCTLLDNNKNRAT